MKRLLAIVALGLSTSIASFAVPCVNGSTLAVLSVCDPGTAVVSNGANSWTFTNFGADTITSTGYGNPPNGASANPYVVATWAPYTLGSQFGFSITFSPAAGQTNLFTATSAGFDQQAAFQTFFSVTANNAASNVQTFGLAFANGVFNLPGVPNSSTSDPNGTGDVSPSFRVNKGILDGGTTFGQLQADETLLFRNPVSIGGITQPSFDVVDGFQINSGEFGATANARQFTNYFLPAAAANPIPEPTSVVLVGAGLVGVTLLRRRT